jgi:glyoxylase-like metal-dependent hydrolase (beta-lactamase superfamily II)/predicted metal-dependent phosphoesterase TrpH
VGNGIYATEGLRVIDLKAIGNGRAIPAGAAVDLHLHTYASDGAWSPRDLVDHLAERDFRIAAVSDHDTQRSVAEAIRYGAERGVSVIPAVEVTTSWNERRVDLLVYGIHPESDDPDAGSFLAMMQGIDDELQAIAASARLAWEAQKGPIPYADELRAGRPLWPYHVLMGAITAGYVKNLSEAANWVTAAGERFATSRPLEDVVAVAQRAGGICVVAHPGREFEGGNIQEADVDAMRASIPIDGIEAHYRSYTDAKTEAYRAIADARGLLIACGSDSHAPGQPVDPRPWRAGWCADLLERLGFVIEDTDHERWAVGIDPQAAVDPPPKEDPVITVQTFSSGPIGTHTYLVLNGTGQAAIVDASHDVTEPILAAAKEAGASIEAIVITHPHWDHIGAAAELKERTGAPLLSHPGAAAKLANPSSSLGTMPPTPASKPDAFLEEGNTFELGEAKFAIWHMPGHEPSHIILYHEGQGIILGGDVLFPNGHGRTDIPGSDPAVMRETLKRLTTLPDEVIVYPGHGEPTTIGAERSWMPKN